MGLGLPSSSSWRGSPAPHQAPGTERSLIHSMSAVLTPAAKLFSIPWSTADLPPALEKGLEACSSPRPASHGRGQAHSWSCLLPEPFLARLFSLPSGSGSCPPACFPALWAPLPPHPPACLWSPSYLSNKPQFSKGICRSSQSQTNLNATLALGSLAACPWPSHPPFRFRSPHVCNRENDTYPTGFF